MEANERRGMSPEQMEALRRSLENSSPQGSNVVNGNPPIQNSQGANSPQANTQQPMRQPMPPVQQSIPGQSMSPNQPPMMTPMQSNQPPMRQPMPPNQPPVTARVNIPASDAQQRMALQQTMGQQPMQSPMQQPMQQQRSSMQEQLRNRMRQEQSSGASPQSTVSTQTRNYQPVQGQPNPMVQPNNMGNPNSMGNPQQSTSTIINTTVTDGVQQGTDNPQPGGFRLGKNVIYIIVAAILALLLLAYFLFGGDKKGKPGEQQTVPEESLEWIDPVNVQTFLYTPDEIDKLRTAGYTGTEIEQYQATKTPAKDLIELAEAKRDAWTKEKVVPLYDMSSDEYKHRISQTWLTLPQRTDAAQWTQIGAYYNERKNLDYEKIDVYGNQLFIKVYLDDSEHKDWFFLCVKPDEWVKLSDKGNVIVNYTYCTHLVGDDYLSAVEDKENIYITNASLEIIK